MPAALTLEEKKLRSQQRTNEVVETEAPKETGQDKSTRRRNVFNGTEGKLKVRGTIPGYHLHVLNDITGRIDTALQGGYEFVTESEIEGVTNNVTSRNTDIGDKVRFLVGKTDTGEPLYAYLMKIKQEWYDEDQAAIAEKNNKVDSALKKGKPAGIKTDGFYVPSGGIKMSN